MNNYVYEYNILYIMDVYVSSFFVEIIV